jgi:hypothetical protein
LLRRIFDPDSIGSPQFLAAGLLLIYLLQCLWLIHVQTLHGSLPESSHALVMYDGLSQWKGGAIAGSPNALPSEAITGTPSAGRAGHLRVRDGYDEDRSALYYLVAGAPLLMQPRAWPSDSSWAQWWWAAPYLLFGVMLGGSLWYVARRLYGNGGGYIALLLYCFSPGMILAAAGAGNLGEMGGVWGAFGTVFTAIAVAHTLYAPREVVLWNWKRIFLLGLSIGLAVGTQFSLAVVVLVALALMFWVAPVRPRAVAAIWINAVGVGVVILLASYFFRPELLWQGIRHARWIDFEPAAFGMHVSYAHLFTTLVANSPPLMLALPVALVAYGAWKRTRYFGNTAPLLIAGLMFMMAVASPDLPGQGFSLLLLVFAFVFVAGVFADLLETGQKLLVTAGLYGLLSASALWNLVRLAQAQ